MNFKSLSLCLFRILNLNTLMIRKISEFLNIVIPLRDIVAHLGLSQFFAAIVWPLSFLKQEHIGFAATFSILFNWTFFFIIIYTFISRIFISGGEEESTANHFTKTESVKFADLPWMKGQHKKGSFFGMVSMCSLLCMGV